MPGPLEGFNVLDLSAVVSGPLTAALLADQGASVIKVERVGAGDIQRHVGSLKNGFSGFFHVLNRGKRSIAVDLTTDEGQAIVTDLARGADVVLQNFRPGKIDRLNLGYAALNAVNPALVYLSISGFGQTGPRAGDRAYDPIIQMYSGIAAVQGRIHADDPDTPEQVNMLLLDKLTAWTGSQAITAALLARSKTGNGQHIELSMLDTAIAFGWADTAADLILQSDDQDERPPVGASGNVAGYADGYGATMTLGQAEFEGMCRAYGLPEIAEDPRFASLEARIRNRDAMRSVIGERIAPAARGMTIADADAAMRQHGVPFAHARKLTDLRGDPQVQHNAVFRELDHPVAGPLVDARPAPRFSATPAQPGGPAPTVGQHTREILAEIGRGADFEDLVKRGVVS